MGAGLRRPGADDMLRVFHCDMLQSVMQNTEHVRAALIPLSLDLSRCPVHYDCEAVPGEFIKRKSNAKVREIILLKYGKSECSYRTGNVEVPCPGYVKKTLFYKAKLSLVAQLPLSTMGKTFPDFLVKTFGNVISNAQMIQLVESWDRFANTGVKPHGGKHTTWSSVPAFHFGVWRRYKKGLHITKDTRSIDPIIREYCDAFLTLLRNRVASKITTYMENYAPRIWKNQKK